MPADRTGNTISQARDLTLRPTNTAVREWVGNADPSDFYRITFGQRSRLFAGIRGKRKGVRMQLVQDDNDNGRLDAGEIIRQRRSRNNQMRRLNVRLDPGTYFLKVRQWRGNSRYRMVARARTLNAAPPPSPTPDPPSSELNNLRQEILQLVNQKRQQHSLAPVTLDNRLNSAAQTHSVNMALQDFFSHAGADGSRSGDRVNRTGYEWSRVSENIAAGYTSATSVVEGWMNSDGHRANILDPYVAEMGLGYKHLSPDPGAVTYRHYWTQVFANPR